METLKEHLDAGHKVSLIRSVDAAEEYHIRKDGSLGDIESLEVFEVHEEYAHCNTCGVDINESCEMDSYGEKIIAKSLAT